MGGFHFTIGDLLLKSFLVRDSNFNYLSAQSFPTTLLLPIRILKSNKLLNYSKNLAHVITKRVHFCHTEVVLRHGCDVYATALCRSTIIAFYMDVHMHHFFLCTLFHYILNTTMENVHAYALILAHVCY